MTTIDEAFDSVGHALRLVAEPLVIREKYYHDLDIILTELEQARNRMNVLQAQLDDSATQLQQVKAERDTLIQQFDAAVQAYQIEVDRLQAELEQRKAAAL